MKTPIYHDAQHDLSTIRDFIRFCLSRFYEANLFFGHGTDNAWDEAVALILQALHLPPDTSQKILNAKLTTTEKKHILELIQQRVEKRIPLPYLFKQASFAGLSFYVDERVLIPRSPMAELIETEFTPWINPDRVFRILDLCTGSGCIAIACALAFPESHVDAADISPDCLAVAKINIERYDLSDRVHLYLSDLFNALPKQHYDIIISNPPYVDCEDMAMLPAEFLHEPRLALNAGEDGLEIVKRILAQAKDYLTPEGILVVEVGNSETALQTQFPHLSFMWPSFKRGGDGVFLLTREQFQ